MKQQSNALVVNVIVTEDHVAVLEPAVALLEPLLQYRSRRFVPGGPLGYQEIEEDVSLCEIDKKDRLCFAAGLLPRVRRSLQEHGYRLCVEDQRSPNTRLAVDEGVLKDADEAVKSLLRAVANQPLGQIETATRTDAVDKMVQVGELFPEASVVVAVATKKQVRSLWRKLRKYMGGTVGRVLPGVNNTKKRWLVAHFDGVPRDEAGAFDILLLPHGEESVGDKAVETVVRMKFQRIYAFIQPQRRPDRLVQLRLEQMAGSVIDRVRKSRASVCVLMLPTPVYTIVAAGTDLERKRAFYWHNATRNNHIAAVAAAELEGDRAGLKAFGLRNKDIRLFKDVDVNKVVILVESPEHGRDLLARLPGWKMLHLASDTAAGAVNDITDGNKTPAVATAAYASKNTIRADVVIRATGMGWPLRMKGFPPKRTKRGLSEVLVVDFDDEFSMEAREHARRRVQEYQREGMRVTNLKHRDQ